MLETLDYTMRIGNTPTFYLYSAYAVHYVYYFYEGTGHKVHGGGAVEKRGGVGHHFHA